MSRRNQKNQSQAEAPGQDSFLDVVANLVGILIILVMVVGTQAKDAIVAELTLEQASTANAASPLPPLTTELPDVAGEELAAQSVENSLKELEGKIEREQMESEMRSMERERLLTLVGIAEKKLAEHRETLSDEEKANYDVQSQLNLAKGEMASLTKAKLADTKPPTAVLQHLPTPMAKTVFGKEIQFRLKEGKLAYLPWEEMVLRLKTDAPNQVSKLRDAKRVESSLPMINGFAARYILRRNEEQGAVRVELEKIYFLQVERDLGEPVSQALQVGSEFRSRLAAYPTQTSTVTLWVYPDSFDDFRLMKAELFKLGYLVAGRPMPDGVPIGGSPDGSRASSE